jgi:ADP-ribose pyrophosphatase YjhB (NUDIX family)
MYYNEVHRHVTQFPKPFQHYRPRSHRVYGVICLSDKDTYLLVRGQKTGIWSFPKGHMKDGEMAQECALRELKEETGLTLESYRFYATRKLFAGEYFLYRTCEEPVYPADSAEISEVGWFSLSDMEQMACNADIKKFLRGRG